MPRLNIPVETPPTRKLYRSINGGWVLGSWWAKAREGYLSEAQAKHYLDRGVIELVTNTEEKPADTGAPAAIAPEQPPERRRVRRSQSKEDV